SGAVTAIRREWASNAPRPAKRTTADGMADARMSFRAREPRMRFIATLEILHQIRGLRPRGEVGFPGAAHVCSPVAGLRRGAGRGDSHRDRARDALGARERTSGFRARG